MVSIKEKLNKVHPVLT